jgi:hypothetical protein
MVVAASYSGQREERKGDTDDAGLEASTHAEATLTSAPGKPEERQ